MSYKVLIPQDVAQVGKEYLSARGHEVVVGSSITPEVLKREIADCDALLLRSALLTAEVLQAAKKLRVIAKHGIGVDNIDLVFAAEHGIWVTNAPLSNAATVAEHTLGLVLALARNIVQGDRAVRNGDFAFRDRTLGYDLAGKTLGLIGLGRIGSALAKKAARGFEMNVLGYDPFIAEGMLLPEVELTRDWEAIFTRSDFISLHVPLTEKTRGLVGKRELSMMKSGAYLLSVSRGGVVDEKALIAALRERKIAGAGLDVFEVEPPTRDNALLSMDNVILTPHNAALTEEAAARMSLHAAMGIHEVLTGEEPSWPVSRPQLGNAIR